MKTLAAQPDNKTSPPLGNTTRKALIWSTAAGKKTLSGSLILACMTLGGAQAQGTDGSLHQSGVRPPVNSRQELNRGIRFRRLSKAIRELSNEEKKTLWIGFDILPIDRDTLLVFGALHTSAASIGTFLLRSSDGGNTWTETMAPIQGSTVSEVVFNGKRLGWALVFWTTEGPGDVLLYKTRNGGKTWRRVAEIPKRHYWGMPSALDFSDEKHGSVEMFYDDVDGPEQAGLSVLTTADGGGTWRESRRLSLAEYERREQQRAGTLNESQILSGQDGSEWKTEPEGEGANQRTRILRRLPGNAFWQTACVIPTDFMRN